MMASITRKPSRDLSYPVFLYVIDRFMSLVITKMINKSSSHVVTQMESIEELVKNVRNYNGAQPLIIIIECDDLKSALDINMLNELHSRIKLKGKKNNYYKVYI